MSGPTLILGLESAAQLTASGSVGSLNLSATAASIAHLSALQVDQAQVSLHAASVVDVSASQSVRGEAHEASVLKIHGDPVWVDVETSEASQIVR